MTRPAAGGRLVGCPRLPDQVAVRPDQRGEGLRSALLADVFAEGRQRGLPRAGLATDSRTGALALYEDIGMVVTATLRHLVLDV